MKIFTTDEVMKKDEFVKIELQTPVPYRYEPVHMHDFIEIVFVCKGRGTHYINNTPYAVQYGSLLFINCGYTHVFQSSEEMAHYNIFIRPEFFTNEIASPSALIDMLSLTMFEDFKLSDIAQKSYIEFNAEESAALEFLFRSMLREYELRNIGYVKVMNALLQVILTHFLRKMMLSNVSEIKKAKLSAEMLEYVHTHYNEKLSLKELAAKSFYNPSYFSRIFKETTGMSMIDYIQDLRIENACKMLITTSKTVEEIAVAVGYSSSVRFHEVFKKLKGTTPQRYRKEQNRPDFYSPNW